MDTNPFLNESTAARRPPLHAVPLPPSSSGAILRDALVALCRGELEGGGPSRPICAIGGTQLQIRCRPVVPGGVLVSGDAMGRPTVMMTFGGTLHDPEEVLALTLDDAERLAVALDDALEAHI